MTLNDFITLQEQYTKHELCQNMAETLVATTKERLYRHSHEYNWTISYLEHTDKNKVFLITKKNKNFPLIKRLIVIMDVNMKNCRLPMKKTESQMVVII